HLELEISNFNTLIELAKTHGNAPDTLAKEEAILQDAFNRSADDLCATYGMTRQAFATYMGKNGYRINDYLGNNPEVKERISALSAELSSLLAALEEAKRTE
ncbi:MAG: hypothetical protein V1793_25750, partial [Pseudomonadota bacterium]